MFNRHPRLLVPALFTALLLAAAIGARDTRARQTSGSVAPRMYVTPALIAPAAKVSASVHLRGLVPNTAVEVQIDPPAPAMVTLADVHTRASRRGTVDVHLSFAGAAHGPYVLFVNLGNYADPKSTLKGSSLQGVIPVDLPGPHLALPCGLPLRGTIACSPVGYGFRANESVALTYRIQTGTPKGGQKLTVMHQTTHTDANGMFVRPYLSFNVDERVLSYRITFTARGARGDHAESGTAATP